jgi:hypothetical protein
LKAVLCSITFLSSPKVAYQCTAGQENILRRTGLVYPDGRTLAYEYGKEG